MWDAKAAVYEYMYMYMYVLLFDRQKPVQPEISCVLMISPSIDF